MPCCQGLMHTHLIHLIHYIFTSAGFSSLVLPTQCSHHPSQHRMRSCQKSQSTAACSVRLCPSQLRLGSSGCFPVHAESHPAWQCKGQDLQACLQDSQPGCATQRNTARLRGSKGLHLRGPGLCQLNHAARASWMDHALVPSCSCLRKGSASLRMRPCYVMAARSLPEGP